MHENEIAKIVVDAAFKVHTTLGPGLLESVYEVCLAHELNERGLEIKRQVSIPIKYNDIVFSVGFKADLIVEDKVIVELKSSEESHPSHKKQIITYIKLAGKHLGLLINFGSPRIKDGISRVVNNLPE